MGFCHTLLRVILAAEALLLIPGLPAWSGFANASLATQSYLLCLGVFSAVAVATLLTDKPSCRIWAWATAVTNIPVPALAPVGLVLVLLLLALHLKPSRRPDWPARVGTWWPWLVGLGFCWGAAWNVHRFSQISGLPFTPALLLFGGLLVLMPSCVVVHQAGHWLAGRHSELAVVSAWSGWADPQPAALDSGKLNQRLLLWTLGGPLASLTWGALLLLAFISSPGSAWAGIGELTGLAATCSLAIFLISILPWRAAGYRSDGAALIAIMRHGPEYRRDRALALIAGDWLRGAPPRNWSPDHLRAAASVPSLSRHHATGCSLNYLYCLDRDFGSSARYWAGRLVNEFANDRSAVPARWRLEIAYYLATSDCSGRAADAPDWRRSVGRGQGTSSPVLLRSDAALEVSRGNSASAAALILAAEQAAMRDLHCGFWQFELELLDRLRNRIEPALMARLSAEKAALSLQNSLTRTVQVPYNGWS